MTGAEGATAAVTITHPVGLHARPAVKFTKLAKTFPTVDIRLRGGADGDWIDAKSIVKVMALRLRTGAILEIRAAGDQAAAAVDALKSLVERDFDEGRHP